MKTLSRDIVVVRNHCTIVASNFPCALSLLHQTLRRKGLGLDGSELDSEESMQVAADKYPLSEGMDLSVARQRFYVSDHILTPYSVLTLDTHRPNTDKLTSN